MTRNRMTNAARLRDKSFEEIRPRLNALSRVYPTFVGLFTRNSLGHPSITATRCVVLLEIRSATRGRPPRNDEASNCGVISARSVRLRICLFLRLLLRAICRIRVRYSCTLKRGRELVQFDGRHS